MTGQGLESRQSKFMLSTLTPVCAVVQVVFAELLSMEFLLGSGIFGLRCE